MDEERGAVRKRDVRESRLATRGERRRPSRSDLRERQCGDAAGRSGANEAGKGALQGVGSAVMR